jgi:hypothetical protein
VKVPLSKECASGMLTASFFGRVQAQPFYLLMPSALSTLHDRLFSASKFFYFMPCLHILKIDLLVVFTIQLFLVIERALF